MLHTVRVVCSMWILALLLLGGGVAAQVTGSAEAGVELRARCVQCATRAQDPSKLQYTLTVVNRGGARELCASPGCVGVSAVERDGVELRPSLDDVCRGCKVAAPRARALKAGEAVTLSVRGMNELPALGEEPRFYGLRTPGTYRVRFRYHSEGGALPVEAESNWVTIKVSAR